MSKNDEDEGKTLVQRELLKGAPLSRRALLKTAVTGLLLVPALLISPSAKADGKASKISVGYQDKPLGARNDYGKLGHVQECSNCASFIPGSSSKKNGACKVVKGSISPHGWCVLYTPAAALGKG